MRTAIVGCGSIARVHAAVLSRMENVELIAFADKRIERAKALAAEWPGRAYASLEAMLDQEKIDVLHICTPHPLHTPMAALAVARGVHVFTEKPPVTTKAQWAEFEALAENPSKARVGVCFQNRYNPAVKRGKAAITSGEMGRVLGARAFVSWQREAAYYTESDWRGSWETEGGGCLINQSIHTLDLLVHLLGTPTRCEAQMANHSLRGVIEVEDTVSAYLRFSDVSAIFHATNAYATNAPVFVEIALEKATLRLEGDKLTILHADGTAETPDFTLPDALGKGYWGNGHFPCIADFYRCVATGQPFMNDPAGVKDTMRVMLAIYDRCRDDVAAPVCGL